MNSLIDELQKLFGEISELANMEPAIPIEKRNSFTKEEVFYLAKQFNCDQVAFLKTKSVISKLISEQKSADLKLCDDIIKQSGQYGFALTPIVNKEVKYKDMKFYGTDKLSDDLLELYNEKEYFIIQKKEQNSPSTNTDDQPENPF